MIEKDKEILNRLIRYHENVVGSSRATLLALRAFVAAVEELQCPAEALPDQLKELIAAVKNTHPKIIPLIHLIEEFELELEPHLDKDTQEAKAVAIEILHAKHDKLQEKSGKIIELGLTCVEKNDTIVVHTINLNVISIITLAHQVMNKQIDVILLQQDLAGAKRIVGQLRIADVKHVAVPEYALNHYIGKANKMFCAALSITADGQVVAPVGTANVTSLCHFHHIPVYLFANTLKFAHGIAQEQQIHQEIITQAEDADTYELTTYSHDIMDLKLVDYLVTEDGIYPKEKIPPYMKELHARQASLAG